MRMIYRSLCIFFCCLLTANADAQPSFESREADPASIVEGVSSIFGNFSERAIDLVVPGPDPLVLSRFYSSSDTDANFGGWRFGAQCYLSVQKDPKRRSYSDGIHVFERTYIHIGTDEGSVLAYMGWQNTTDPHAVSHYKFDVEQRYYMANIARGASRDCTNQKNNKLLYQGEQDRFILVMSNGSKRFYCKGSSENGYVLVKEVLPGGNMVLYKYDGEDRPVTVQLKNSSEKKVLSWVHLRYGKSVDVVSSDGQTLQYQFDDTMKQPLLTKVVCSGKPAVTYHYQIVEDTPQIVRKELPAGRYADIEYDAEGKVRAVTSAITDRLTACTHFTYEVFDDGSGTTEIHGPSGEKIIHTYNEDAQLSSIEEHMNGSPYRIERKIWGERKDACNLLQRSIEDGAGQFFYCKTFSYDLKGNILKEREYGNLTGANPHPLRMDADGVIDADQECHEKTYAHYSEGELDVIEQRDAKGSGVCYYYSKRSDRLLKKLLFESSHIRKRWFYEYNEDGALSKIVVDDGDEQEMRHPNVVWNKRFITKITPKSGAPHCGAPEIIEEAYFDKKSQQEVLLHKTINHFDERGHVVRQEIYDATGDYRYAIERSYEHGRLIRESDPRGNETRYCYDTLGNLIEKVDSATGKVTEYNYNLQNMPTSIVEKAEGHTFETSIEYDASGRIVSETDYQGNTTHYAFDELGRMQSVTHAGKCFAYEYDLFDGITKIIDPSGAVSTQTNTVRGKPVHIYHADGVHELFKYDPEGSLHRHCSRNGTVRVFEYDYMGRISHIEHYGRSSKGSGQWLSSVEFGYNAFSLTSSRDANSVKTTYEYNAAGRLISMEKGCQKIEYFYDTLGRCITTKKWKSESTFTCEHRTYDAVGNIVAEFIEDTTGKLLAKIEYAYDQAGRLASVIGYPHNEQATLKRYEYDAFGRICKITDPFGEATTISYRDNCIHHTGIRVSKKSSTDPMGNTTEEVYDSSQNLLAVYAKNPEGTIIASTEYVYDALNNPIERNDSAFEPRNKKPYHTKNTYLPGGVLESQHIAAGSAVEKSVTFAYNSYGDVISEEEMGAPSPITYTYDAAGSLKKISADKECFRFHFDRCGNIKSATLNETHSLEYTFSANDEWSSETTRDHFGSYKVKLKRDGEGCIEQIEFPDGSCVHYEYEGPYVKQAVRLSRYNEELYRYEVRTRDLMGNILTAVLPGCAGVCVNRFDRQGRQVSLSTDFFEESVAGKGCDAIGNITQKNIRYDDEPSVVAYTYDALNQLLSEEGHTYSYDTIGNRLSKDGIAYTFDEDGILRVGDAIYTFDVRGNLTSKAIGDKTWRFEYNAFNQLTSITTPDKTLVSFAYDHSGRRLSKTVQRNGQSRTFRFFYIGQTELGCLDEKGNIIELRIPSDPNQPERAPFFSVELNGETFVPISDLQNNITCLVDPEQREIQESYRYSAFGEERIFNHRGRYRKKSAFNNPWRYRSHRIDNETGLMYIGCRYYNPEIGRWITPDPAGDIDGPNRHLYCRNNPLKYADYTGLASEEITSPVDEQYFFGEYEPRCPCKIDRTCKRGGDIATTLGNAWNFSVDIFMHPRVQGGLQAFGGLTEAVIGEGIAFGSGGFAAPVGGFMIAHGADHCATGLGTLIYGREAETLTFQSLHYSGLSQTMAHVIDEGLNTAANLGPGLFRWGGKLLGFAKGSPGKLAQLNRFHASAQNLSYEGKNNIRLLRNWAKSKGWQKIPNPAGAPETWGTLQQNNGFKWHLKIKPESSFRCGLDKGSNIPRFSARLKDGVYINPFTGEVGNHKIGAHLLLNYNYTK